MPKRMRDTGSYKDSFVRKLPSDYKHLWFYILDDCDHAGLWKVDIEAANFFTATTCIIEKALELFNDKIEVISDEVWFVPGFIKFQYGKLSDGNKIHRSVQALLTAKNLDMPSPINGAKDKDKAQVQDKVQAKAKEVTTLDDFAKFYSAYPNHKAKQDALKAWLQVAPALEAVLAALAWQRKQEDWTKEGGKFVPLPATYLRGRRWEDEKPGWAYAQSKEREVHVHNYDKEWPEGSGRWLCKCSAVKGAQ